MDGRTDGQPWRLEQQHSWLSFFFFALNIAYFSLYMIRAGGQTRGEHIIICSYPWKGGRVFIRRFLGRSGEGVVLFASFSFSPFLYSHLFYIYLFSLRLLPGFPHDILWRGEGRRLRVIYALTTVPLTLTHPT
ncbi:hypothetical protein F4809DRAFT_184497 [Biscogniauxia mediterranea]|nr:hypothetical protein F4809DRAFT_184497 [Biscogniauxia mediterranea]